MADRSFTSVARAVHVHAVAHYLGEFTTVAALVVLGPLVAALCFGELGAAGTYALVGVGLGAVGLLLRRAPKPRHIQNNEALVVSVAIFCLIPLVMAGPLALNAGLRPLDALFEAVSAITTTGLSTLDGIEGRPKVFLFSRAWMQWVGGLGIVVLSVALLIGPGMAARRLGLPDATPENVVENTRVHVRRMLRVYLVLTALGLALLLLLRVPFLDALLHVFAAVSTGGFSSRDASIAGLGGGGVQAAVVLISFSGALSLPVYRRLRKTGWRGLVEDLELLPLLGLSLALGAALAALTVPEGGFRLGALRDASILAVSAQTTTGFSGELTPSALGAAAKLLLCLAMLAGGCVGSTAGGVKILRVLVLLRLLHWMVMRGQVSSRAILPIRLGGRRLGSEDIERALSVILLFLGTVAAGWLAFLLYGYDPIDSLFEVVSAVGTVGLSTGITGPSLEPALKLVLCALMLLGRLEILAFLVALSPAAWWGRRSE